MINVKKKKKKVDFHHTSGAEPSIIDFSPVAKQNKETFPKSDLVHLTCLTLSKYLVSLLVMDDVIS